MTLPSDAKVSSPVESQEYVTKVNQVRADRGDQGKEWGGGGEFDKNGQMCLSASGNVENCKEDGC